MTQNYLLFLGFYEKTYGNLNWSFLNFLLKALFVLLSEAYQIVEAPKGEFVLVFIYLLFYTTSKPYRCHIKAPGFLHFLVCTWNLWLKVLYLLYVVTIIGTQDIVFGFRDRPLIVLSFGLFFFIKPTRTICF